MLWRVRAGVQAAAGALPERSEFGDFLKDYRGAFGRASSGLSFHVKDLRRVLQFVSVDRRAWHAGRSSWQGRENCNDYSVGIELEGLEGGLFFGGGGLPEFLRVARHDECPVSDQSGAKQRRRLLRS